MATPDNFKISRMVLDTYGNMVADLQAMTAEEIADLVGRVVKLLVGQY
jgi:hypothetical protein